jgi:hypothetical protein
VSKSGAITLWHADFTGTTVFYALVKGVKVFHVIRATTNNMRLWEGFLQSGRHNLFFGSHPSLDGGGCQKFVLTERQAVIIPAGMFHCVETVGLSMSLGQFP